MSKKGIFVLLHIMLLIISLLYILYVVCSGIIILTIPGVFGSIASSVSINMLLKKKIDTGKHIWLFLCNNILSILMGAISLYCGLFRNNMFIFWVLPLILMLIMIVFICCYIKNTDERVVMIFSNLIVYYFLLISCFCIALL